MNTKGKSYFKINVGSQSPRYPFPAEREFSFPFRALGMILMPNWLMLSRVLLLIYRLVAKLKDTKNLNVTTSYEVTKTWEIDKYYAL